MRTQERIASAETQLYRIHSFFPRIDTRVGAISALILAEIATAALNVKPGDISLWYISLPAVCLLASNVIAAYHIWKCLFPDPRGGAQSYIHFAQIAARTEAIFIHEYNQLTDEQILKDLSAQIWRNSEIVRDKYHSLKLAMTFGTIAIPFWIILLSSTSLSHSMIPIVKV